MKLSYLNEFGDMTRARAHEVWPAYEMAYIPAGDSHPQTVMLDLLINLLHLLDRYCRDFLAIPSPYGREVIQRCLNPAGATSC